MKKTLFGTCAALALATTPAQAGPALEALMTLFPADASVSYETEAVSGMDEDYTGLQISYGDGLTRFDQVALSLNPTRLSLLGNGLHLTDSNGKIVSVANFGTDLPLRLIDLKDTPDTDLCDALSDPLRVRAEGIDFNGSGRVETVSLETRMRDPQGTCVLSLEQVMTGLDIVQGRDGGLQVARQEIRMTYPALPSLPDQPTGELYGSEISASGISIFIDGVQQARIEQVRASDQYDADSGLALVAAGFNEHLGALQRAASRMASPDLQLPYADLWNGAREVNANATVAVTGLEITGPALSDLSPVPGLLASGSRFDLSLSLNKAEELFRIGARFDGSDSLLADLATELRMEAADPSFNALSPRSLIMAAPLSLVSGSVELSDRGLGEGLETFLGSDPYLLISPALSGMIGAGNAELVSGWVADARNGSVARFAAAPPNPIPVLMLGMLALGDWTSLGPMLNPDP